MQSKLLAVATASVLVATAPAVAAPVKPKLFPLPTPSSGPTSIVPGVDGNLWVTESATGRIARVTPTGAVTEFALANAASYPADIVRATDGNLWFGERHGNSLGRITPAGTIDELPIPGVTAPASSETVGLPGALDLAAGPDAAVWFLLPVSAEMQTPRDELDRMAFDGSVTKVALPAKSAPSSVATGSDGNLWVTLSRTHQIARVTPAGAVSTFAIPAGTKDPTSIAGAPDGGLDFTITAKGGTGLAHISTAGISTVLVPPAKSNDFREGSLVAAADGNLWASGELGGSGGFTPDDRLLRIASNGKITAFRLPIGSSPSELAAGPDGAIWFTEFAGNAVGRLPTGGDPVARRKLPGGPSVSPGTVSARGGKLTIGFKTPEYLPLSPPILPGDDSADGEGPGFNEPAGFVLSVVASGRTQGHDCSDADTFAILPVRRKGVSNVYSPEAGRTNTKVKVKVKLRPRLCLGRYKVSLSYGYELAAGPASDFIGIIDYPRVTSVRVR